MPAETIQGAFAFDVERRKHPASFRDASTFVYRDAENRLLRQINQPAADDYRQLIDSGLYDQLTEDRLLVEHEEAPLALRADEHAGVVIAPRELPLITYPYEWPATALRDAALLTLEAQRRALTVGMHLVDAVGHNVQFDEGRPLFIDTLAFRRRTDNAPWPAQRQFLRNFFAPLLLASTRDERLLRLPALFEDGVPLDLTLRLMPWMKQRFGDAAKLLTETDGEAVGGSREAMFKQLERLHDAVSSIDLPRGNAPASPARAASWDSEPIVEAAAELFSRNPARSCWYLNGDCPALDELSNSHVGSRFRLYADPSEADGAYRVGRERGERAMELAIDLRNPSSDGGWCGAARQSLRSRGPVDLASAVGVTQPGRPGEAIPLFRLAESLHGLTRVLLIDCPDDERCRTEFESAMERWFDVVYRGPAPQEGNLLFLMRSL